MTEDEMVGWHHRLNGHEFEPTPGDSEAFQGSLVCCSLWGRKELGMTEQQQQTQTLTRLSCRSPPGCRPQGCIRVGHDSATQQLSEAGCKPCCRFFLLFTSVHVHNDHTPSPPT